jgi:hypothetical protein
VKAKNLTIHEMKISKPNKHARSKNWRSKKRYIPTWNEEIKNAYELKKKYNIKWLETRDYNFRRIHNFYRSKVRRLEKSAMRNKIDNRAMELTKDFNAKNPRMWRRLDDGLNEKVESEIKPETALKTYKDLFNRQPDEIENAESMEVKQTNDERYNEIIKEKGNIFIPLRKITDIIAKLKNKKAQGAMKISNEMFKYGGPSLGIITCLLITNMVNHGCQPQSMWV